MSTLQPKIHLAVAAIIQGINAIPKDKRNDAQKFNFRGIDDVFNALHPLFASHGVICIQSVDSLRNEVSETIIERNGFKETKRNFRSFVIVTYSLIAPDGSSIVGKGAGEGADHGDKATAKALTAACKSFLLQTFLIPTAENDADYEPTINAAGELRASEENAKREVESSAYGAQVQLSPEDQAKLDAKRETTKKVRSRVIDAAPAPTEHKEPTEAPENSETAQAEVPIVENEDWQNHIIAQISKSGIKGKKVKELTADQLEFIRVKWIEAYAEAIESNPAKKIERDFILLAIANSEDKATK